MNGKKILMIEDDPDMRRGLNVRLRANGYETVAASDALSAVKVALEEKPDLIILDIGLPAGDGFVVMERFKDLLLLSCIPIIILTARDPEINRERALEAGAIAFFQKPADNAKLLAAIRKALGEPGEPANTEKRDSPTCGRVPSQMPTPIDELSAAIQKALEEPDEPAQDRK